MFKKARVLVLTNFSEFLEGYSLVTIVRDQVTMLAKYGHEVTLCAQDRAHKDRFTGIPETVKVDFCIPFAHLYNFESLEQFSTEYVKKLLADGKKEDANKITDLFKMKQVLVDILVEKCRDYDIVISHDWVFQGWHLPHGLAISEASARDELSHVRWLHHIHSVPMGQRTFWRYDLYGDKHLLLYPNESDRIRIAEQFRTFREHVECIPHIVDYRTFGGFSKDAWDFVDWCPELQEADFVQILPASVDRMASKRVPEIINIFSELKKLKKSVCLVIANQWCNVPKHKQAVEDVKRFASDLGLIPGKDLFFVSDWREGKHGVGVNRHLLFELMHYANINMCASREESFGLYVAENALVGAGVPCINMSLDVLKEITQFKGIYFDFGSFSQKTTRNPEQWDAFFKGVALILKRTYDESPGLKIKDVFRKYNNMDHIYKNHYSPIFAKLLRTV